MPLHSRGFQLDGVLLSGYCYVSRREKMIDATQLIKDYVAAVLEVEVSDSEEVYERCETLWLAMVELAQGAE